ncbi:hypothetical protein [Candidatus Poriferisodalis sp.]|uniref:hypothetical protein n=1 Tax=Candidatus Poriferisodalis sp. TaxID=3101277 RepID=UPI003D0FAB2D
MSEFKVKLPGDLSLDDHGANGVARITLRICGATHLGRAACVEWRKGNDNSVPTEREWSALEYVGELHRWMQVNGHDDRCQHMQPTDGGVQYGSEAEFG